jgi:acyl-CoA thioesterase
VTKFERDSAVERVAPGRWRARLDRSWWIALGPNGGYMAAVLLRAIDAEVADADRAPRSLTVHYVSRPESEDVEIVTSVVRAGRSLTTVAARMVQGERVIAVALAALSQPRRLREPIVLSEACLPAVTPLARAERWQAAAGSPAAEFHRNLEMRWAAAVTPFSGSAAAHSAAWARLAEPVRPDAPVLALFADALPPAIFSVATGFGGIGPVPTIDLTIHFRAPLPPAGVAPDDFVLLHFATRLVSEGFLEEDGEIWSADGTLLAQSRQLAILA